MEAVQGLGQLWYERFILKKIKNPAVVERILRRHIYLVSASSRRPQTGRDSPPP